MENNGDTETLWPRAKTWREQGEDQNSFLSLGYFVWAVSAQQHHCHFGLSFIPTARHTRQFRLLSFPSNLWNPNIGSNKLKSCTRGLSSTELTLLLSQHGNPPLVMTVASPLPKGTGRLNITMSTEDLRYWSRRPANGALFPRVAVLF